MGKAGQTGIHHTVKEHGNFHTAKDSSVLKFSQKSPVTSGSSRRGSRRFDRRGQSRASSHHTGSSSKKPMKVTF